MQLPSTCAQEPHVVTHKHVHRHWMTFVTRLGKAGKYTKQLRTTANGAFRTYQLIITCERSLIGACVHQLQRALAGDAAYPGCSKYLGTLGAASSIERARIACFCGGIPTVNLKMINYITRHRDRFQSEMRVFLRSCTHHKTTPVSTERCEASNLHLQQSG